jgi:manganese transport protein
VTTAVAFAPPALPVSRPRRVRLFRLLGPAFVAAIAYVDPGNLATDMTAGATFGYLLVWLVVGSPFAQSTQPRTGGLQ